MQVIYELRYVVNCDGQVGGRRCPFTSCGQHFSQDESTEAIKSAKKRAIEDGLTEQPDGRWLCDANKHD